MEGITTEWDGAIVIIAKFKLLHYLDSHVDNFPSSSKFTKEKRWVSILIGPSFAPSQFSIRMCSGKICKKRSGRDCKRLEEG